MQNFTPQYEQNLDYSEVDYKYYIITSVHSSFDCHLSYMFLYLEIPVVIEESFTMPILQVLGNSLSFRGGFQ